MTSRPATLDQALEIIKQLERRHRELVCLLDQQVGTPCQQIRHGQDVENLTAEITKLKDALKTSRELCDIYRTDYWRLINERNATK